MGKSSRKLHQVAPLSQETEVAITTQLSKLKKEIFVEVVLLFEPGLLAINDSNRLAEKAEH